MKSSSGKLLLVLAGVGLMIALVAGDAFAGDGRGGYRVYRGGGYYRPGFVVRGYCGPVIYPGYCYAPEVVYVAPPAPAVAYVEPAPVPVVVTPIPVTAAVVVRPARHVAVSVGVGGFGFFFAH